MRSLDQLELRKRVVIGVNVKAQECGIRSGHRDQRSGLHEPKRASSEANVPKSHGGFFLSSHFQHSSNERLTGDGSKLPGWTM